MEIDRLPASVATLYAELLDQALVRERTGGVEGLLPGGLVSKTIRGRRYLYWQIRTGNQVVQRYLGLDSGDLRAGIERIAERRHDAAAQQASLDRLASMVIKGGALREQPAVATVIRLLADLGLFRRGAVLVGTQAFRTYGNLLAVRLPASALRTQDIDVAHEIGMALAAAGEPATRVEPSLATLGLLPVPGLDPRQPSTSFHMRGRELRVDFLTPARRGAGETPVEVPGLGVCAWPLRFLDYLIEEPVPAMVLDAKPALVRVPRPARFALHKLWTAAARGVSEQAKAVKDRAQAAAIITVLAAERPDDLREAMAALAARPSARRKVMTELDRIGARQSSWVAR
jgi:hypothetical protein